YLELVKARRYGDHGEEGAASANAALLTTLSTLLRLFAPFLPFVTEEVWSWWRPGSVHAAPWPTEAEGLAPSGAEGARGAAALRLAADVLSDIRKKKSEEQRGLKTAARRVLVRLPADQRPLMPEIERDLRAAGLIERLELGEAEAVSVEVDLAPAES